NRFHPKWLGAKSFPTRENLSAFLKMGPPRRYLIPMLLVMLGLATFVCGISIGGNAFFSATHFFYDLSLAPVATPTPQPPLPKLLPQVGTMLYMVQDGDSCDAILVYEMRMNQASEVFSDVKPETVQALSAALGQDCHRIQ